MDSQGFPERLVKIMEERDLKQVDLLHLASVQGVKLGKSQLSQYISGKTMPRPAVLNSLAELLGVEENWLAGTNQKQTTRDHVAATRAADDERSGTRATTGTTAPLNSGLSATNQSNGGQKFSSTAQKKMYREVHPMRQFKKSAKLENVLYDVRGPVVDEANRMEEDGMSILKLNIGNPATFGFRTPDEVVLDMAAQLTKCEGYSASKGLFSARKAIMQYSQVKDLPNVTMNDIYTGNGVSELINLSMSALLDDGDEILIPSPDYPLWTACATLAGGKVVHYLCDEQADWYPDMDDIRSKITSATKAIVIINPNNPTGALYPREVLQEIVDIAREHQLIIFSDEIYDRLVMEGEGEHVSVASLAPDLFCVTFSGLSKSHMIAGYRIGWMVLSGNKRIARDYILGINMLSNMRLCSNVPAQSIVQTALWGHQSVRDYVQPGGRVYEQREYVYNALKDIPGISVVKPKAAFYIFPKLDRERFNITDDQQFALDLLQDKKVLIVQGTGFNWSEPDHFRIVYLPRIETLKEAVDKLADFLSYYRQ
ncbi:aminotransferase class I/II-fold pyridoxal phosphate-dependent enzyme [Atopobium sp. oral taxon 810]|uniref:aminotransferase class I/II-fold pyridoxal phosphate-dependent enzyme n=1 Tax=Atopobium sp. oral taxon 810 TaxID=712158 RepID=UPI000396B9B2|nr:aminotransferase class I/II-fold pyridoxal phosphate-dependent enzyme [Atopobium sp. oral taxon 810]ERI05448.1 DNA-binding helix-turn-helix protein [Atopobium sp. oral taxon 810 str. F0209]